MFVADINRYPNLTFGWQAEDYTLHWSTHNIDKQLG